MSERKGELENWRLNMPVTRQQETTGIIKFLTLRRDIMRIFIKVSKVQTFLLGIMMMAALLSCSSYVQASQSGDYFNVSEKDTKLIEYLPNFVSGEKGVRFLSRDQSGNYIDMMKNTFGYPNWLWVTPTRQYPNIWNIDVENEKIGAHPSAVVGSGYADLDSIVAVKLNNDFGNINVTGFAGNDNKGQVKHYIYIGENGYLNPLWESESGGAFNINVPYKNGDHLYFAVDAEDDDYYDWAYWQNIHIKGGTTSNVGRTSFFLLAANDPSQMDYLDTGIYVNESESYRITATGRARCDDSQNYTDADGNLWTGASKHEQKSDPSCAVPTASIGTLIGVLKDSEDNPVGTPFMLSSSGVATFKLSGTLVLAYNDYPGQYKDNSGAYFVTIEKITTNTSAFFTTN